MPNPVTPTAPTEDPQVIYDTLRAHNSGLRIYTDTTIQAALLSQYPSYALTSTTCDLLKYADAGYAIATLNEDFHPTLRSWTFEPTTPRPLDGSAAGRLNQTVHFSRFDYVWENLEFQVFVVEGQNDPMGECDRRYYVLHRSEEGGLRDQEGIAAMVLAANIWSQESHEQVWAYDQGHWSKDEELWRMVPSGNWEDVILDESTKGAMMRSEYWRCV